MGGSIYWHDYETFGADPQKDRPSQFAGIRTDLDLNVIGEPLTIYCQPSDDMLPNPIACFITGITPQKCRSEGYIEREFIQQIHQEFSVPETCAAGYNSIRFDDEVTRNTLYRNFYDPYEREWKSGNSRWDIIDMVRLTAAIRPEGIVWPKREDGFNSFRLEELTVQNGIVHTQAHDAMSDVYATIEIAKLIKQKKSRLYDFVFNHRSKHALRKIIDLDTKKPFFHVSSKIPASLGCCAVMMPLIQHPTNQNAIICYDLRYSPDELLSLSSEQIRERLFSKRENIEGDPIALKGVHLNKCPIVTPVSVLSDLDKGRLSVLQLDGSEIRKNLEILRADRNIEEKLTQLYKESEFEPVNDPDLMLYSGGFFSDRDKMTMRKIRESGKEALFNTDFQFDDERLYTMLARYKARNFPFMLSEEEGGVWEAYRIKKLNDPGLTGITFEEYFSELQRLALDVNTTSAQKAILEDLQLYAESIYPCDY